jgi:hypothetical protein
MKTITKQAISVFTILALFAVLLTAINAAETKTTIYVDPQVKNIEPGENFTLNISCIPTQLIEGYEFDIKFDATRLKINSITEGDIFQGFSTWFNHGTIDNVNGYVDNVYSLITNEGNTSASGTLAIISITALSKNGTTTIELNDTGISNELGYIPIIIQNGKINIGDISSSDNDSNGPDNGQDPTNNPPNLPEKPSGKQIGLINVSYQYSTVTTDPDNDQIFYTFDWGDGQTSENIGPFSSGIPCNASHKWILPGIYNITVKAEDIFGKQSDISPQLTIVIQNQSINNSNQDSNITAPIASFTFTPKNPIIQSDIQFTDTSKDSDGAIIKWKWDFGDDTISEEQHPTHQFQKVSTYTVKLTVWDDTGLSDDQIRQISIQVDEKQQDQQETPAISIALLLLIISLIVLNHKRNRK